jgi:hypothetical protein
MKEHRKGNTLSDRDLTVGSVSLTIRGFSGLARVSVDQIVNWVESAPAFHLVGLTAIIYDPHHQLDPAATDSALPASAAHKAQYVKAKRHILVHDFADTAELQHILYHELGHHVWDQVLNTMLRRHWLLELSQRRSRRVTRYAQRNALEDFAESYAVFLCDPARLGPLQRKYDFLRNNVFAGVARNIARGFLDVSV